MTNRFSTFTDEELEALLTGIGWGYNEGAWDDDELPAHLGSEIDAEISRRQKTSPGPKTPSK